MAGSRRSPVLRDQWRASSDTRDQQDREGHRSRGPHRDRGRERYRERQRRRRPKGGRPDHPRSPPPRSFAQPDNEEPRSHREFSPGTASARISPGPPPSDIQPSQPFGRHSLPKPTEYSDLESHHSLKVDRPIERDYRRDQSPSAPPSKRKRTRSPSPGLYPRHSNQEPPRHPYSKQGDDSERSFPHKRGRGRFPGRGRSGRRSPRRGRDRRKDESGRRNSYRPRRSKSPIRGAKFYNHPRRRLHSPHPGDDIEGEPRHRSVSRHSAESVVSRLSTTSRRESLTMHSTRPNQSAANSLRSPTPPRPIPSFDVDTVRASVDGDTAREAFPTHGMRASDARDSKPANPRSHLDTRPYSTSPQYVTPSNSYNGSPQSTSPYSGGRGGWNGHQPPYQGRSPPYRQPPTGPQSQFNSNNIPTGPRGGHSGYRGSFQNQGGNRRFSGSGAQSYTNAPSPRGRGNFNSFQWGGSGSRGRGPHSPHITHGRSSQSPPPPPTSEDQMPMGADQGGNSFRLSGQDRPVGDEKPGSENGDSQKMLPTTGQPDTSATPNKGGKISFAFKAKTAPAPAPKPVPDLAQRMLAREPPPRVAEPPRNKMTSGPPPKFKPEPRFDRRDRDRERERDRHRERDRDRGRNGRRDFRDPRGFRDPRDRRDTRRDDHRFDHRHDRRRDDRRQDFRPERHQGRSPEPKKEPKVLIRPKPRPTLPEEFAKSDSVYYRKPGNESVIGAGTYGKVFKAIHVYTQKKVALKKIRMEGEKDGFPVTAVREIKLLQHLRNHNVVSLLEVMVERNECFMVFEYLSHDLTGLINHPTFTLTAAHKKDLAKQMFEGLSYLHHRGVLHRDIKAANILISNRGQLKYADFGLARFFSKSRQLDYTNRVITIWYRPPELLLGETRYGPAVDVWSAACVYVEMFTKKAVFPGEGGEISQMEKLYNCLGTPTRVDWPDISEMPWFELMRPTERKKRVFEEVYGHILTPAALDLVSQIFRYDPATRPTAEEILAHPYFVSEEPRPQQAIELENIEGDWHEFESKALRKEKDREARRAEYQRDKEKRKAGTSAPPSERETKRARQDAEDSQPSAQATEQ
ncbi:hypothetical protein BDV28DRAFT_24046 [Aspergillus coremiiformis]|uniref:cyclin-dependent kinase n=1 Tax=Aspergillus coremiiformis TaxID=138285 RepID=A0A5N6ZDM2_9EURO|nr:hypothetical protein BDV28DRAFT_24046 [Aspergillus coremiiformis]